MRNWKNFTGKEVVVVASGSRYRGRLVEMTDTSLLLRMATGHTEISTETINSIELSDGKRDALLSPSPLAALPRKEGT